MITVRRSSERGHAQHGWLESYHTFSFADYQDKQYMGFKNLRVLNEDIIQPKSGFGMHSHQNMEIITYIVQGTLEHKDNLGNISLLNAGDVQRMSAGTGIKHSEFNPLGNSILHLLQIWIIPDNVGIKPSYEEQNFSILEKKNKLKLIASQLKKDNSLYLNQNVLLYASILEENKSITYTIAKKRFAWIQVISGHLEINGNHLFKGDGCSICDENILNLTALNECEFLLFDLSEYEK